MEMVIETKNLTKQYGTSTVVDNMNLHVPKGRIYGLLGRNGAGKTTAMRMLLKLASPTAGEIRIFGKDILSNSRDIYPKIGSLIETPGFYENLSGRENLKLIARLHTALPPDAVETALGVVGLEQESVKAFHHFSLGMKQRLGIAAAILHKPELLILDEPINGLDPIGIHEIRSFLLRLSKEKGTTILISSHVLNEIEQLADIIGVMHKGRLIEEQDLSQLQRQNRQYVEFEISDAKAAAELLNRWPEISDIKICDPRTIRIYGAASLRGKLNQALVQNGLSVTKIILSEEKLEDYFSALIGGGGIG